MQYSIWY